MIESVIDTERFGSFFINFVVYIDEHKNTCSYALEKYSLQTIKNSEFKQSLLLKKDKYNNFYDAFYEWRELTNIIGSTIRHKEKRGIESQPPLG